jgi:DNA-binding transcriptional LysR family regulator
MEYWSIGVLEYWSIGRVDCPPLQHSIAPPFHHSTIPPFHHSITPSLHCSSLLHFFAACSMLPFAMRKLINEMSFDSRLLTGIPVVLAVVDAGSFVGAGNALGLTQSGVSRAIQRLEQRLGVRLFERNAKVMRLTETGRQFCQEVGPLISRLQEVAEETVHSATAVRGRLRVNVDPTFARLVLVPRVEAFLDTYPDLQIELVVRDQLGDLIAEGFDAGIRFGQPQPSSLMIRRLLQVRVLTCASPKYLHRRGRPKTPNDLAKSHHECLLFRDPVTGTPFLWEFHKGKRIVTVPVSGRFIVNDALTHLEACIAGMGIAQVFQLGIESMLENGKLVNLFPDWSDELFPLYVYHASRHFVPAKLRKFLDFLGALARDRS